MWNPGCGVLESGIQLKESGIPRTIGIQNPSSNDKNFACVALRFWLGALSNKGGRGQRNHEVFVFLAALPLVRAARQNRHATQANKNWNPAPRIRNP